MEKIRCQDIENTPLNEVKEVESDYLFSYKVEYRNDNLDGAIKMIRDGGFEILDSFEIKSGRHTPWGIKSKITSF